YAPFRTGLVRDQCHAHDPARQFHGLDGVLRHLDAAALAAPAGVDLRLHHHAPAQRPGGRFRLFDRVRHLASRHRDIILGQNGLCLILVNFHGIACVSLQETYFIMSLLPYLIRLVSEHDLPAADAEAAMGIILRGEASHPRIAAFLIALKMKGETVDELVGFARAMRQMAVPIDAGLDEGQTLLDTCGTGGDGANTFNISTVAAFVVAGAGVHVAKHGNRSISSQCGSADLLEAWGIPIDLPPAATGRAIREVGIGFLFAPAVHTAVKHAHPVRVDLKMRTVFNLLGPLTNPAGATAQIIGAPSLHAAELMAGAIAALGMRRGFVVHGSDGLDEITTTGPTSAWEIRYGVVEARILEPGDFA